MLKSDSKFCFKDSDAVQKNKVQFPKYIKKNQVKSHYNHCIARVSSKIKKNIYENYIGRSRTENHKHTHKMN